MSKFFKNRNDFRSGPDRRELLKLLMGGFAGTGLASQLAAAPSNAGHPQPKPLGLSANTSAVLQWNVPASVTNAISLSGALSNGRLIIAPAIDGHIAIFDAQQGAALTPPSRNILGLRQALVLNGVTYLSGVSLDAVDYANPTSPVINVIVASTSSFACLCGSGVAYAELLNGAYAINCIDPATKESLWAAPYATGVANAGTLLPAPVASGHILAMALPGYGIVALDAATGAFLWKFSLNLSVIDISAGMGLCISGTTLLFNTSEGSTLYAVDLTTGQLLWTWQSPAGAISAPNTYNGIAYLGDSSGNINLIQVAAGASVAPGKSLLPISTKDGELTKAPILIEDGVGYVGGASYVHAIDLVSGNGQSLQYPATSPTLLAVENGVVYFLNTVAEAGGKNSAYVGALNKGGQLHQFFCESSLMAGDYTASTSTSSAYQPASPTYQTHIQLLDENAVPRAAKSIRIWATEDVSVGTPGGATVSIGPSTATWVQTDAMGELYISTAAADIHCPALYLWGNFMDKGEVMVIYPDHPSLTALSAKTGSDYKSATGFDGATTLLPGDYPAASASGLASTVTNTLGLVTSSGGASVEGTLSFRSSRSRHSAVRIPKHPDPGIELDAEASAPPYIAYPNTMKNMRYQAPGGAPDRPFVPGAVSTVWSTTFNSDGTLTYTPGGSLSSTPAGRGLRPLAAAADDFDAFVHDVVKGSTKITHMVYNGASTLAHDIEVVGGRIYHVVADTVEKAVSVVIGILKTVISDIVKVVEWVCWLFDWTDILNIKDQIKSKIQTNITQLSSWATSQQQRQYADVHSALQQLDPGAIAISQSNLGSDTIQSKQVNQNDPQSSYGASGAQSYTPTRSMQSKVTNNSGQGSADDPSSDPTLIKVFDSFCQSVESKLSSDFKNLVGDMETFITNFRSLMHDPGQFVHSEMTDLIQFSRDLIKTIIDFADALVESFLQSLVLILDALMALATRPIRIPVVSDLWKLISGGAQLTILDLCALLIAIPTTIVQKAIQSASTAALSVETSNPPVLNENVGYTFALGTYAVLDSMTDLLDFEALSVIGGVSYGTSLIVQGLNFPTAALSSSGTPSLILYAFSFVPLVLTAVDMTLSKVAPERKKSFQGLSLTAQAAYGTIMIGMVSSFAPTNPLVDGNKHEGLAAGIIGSVPYLFKILGNGEALSPQRVVLSALDAACDVTVGGLTIAQWT